MYWNFDSMLKMFNIPNNRNLLLDGSWGLEKESQRITPNGNLALTPHPSVFGDKLKNPNVTTDFSESQLEIITPPFDSIEKTYNYLGRLEEYVENSIENELIWPLSMPPRLPEEDKIPVARFSKTIAGKEKEIYRSGLALRYGKKMQMISGIHYNFSIGDKMMNYLYDNFSSTVDRQDFTDYIYLWIIRNYLRYRWLLIYLFGASPTVDPTYYPIIDQELKLISRCCPECCGVINEYEQYATSLRVSCFGYSNLNEGKNAVYFNTLDEYIHVIRSLLKTKSKKYASLGIYKNGIQVQLNDNILQKESEFYSPIRPKQITKDNETQLDALEKRGIKYLEARIFDLNPFYKTGISLEQLYFLQIFMLFCLFEESDELDDSTLKKINKNHNIVALCGRKNELELYKYDNEKILLKKWGKSIFKKLIKIAQLADAEIGNNTYEYAIKREHEKLCNSSLLPSTLIHSEIKNNNEDHVNFGIRRALTNKGCCTLNKEEIMA